MYPNNAQYLQELYRDATTPPLVYLFIDLKQETQENLRLRAENQYTENQTAGLCTSTKVNEISSQEILQTYDEPPDKNNIWL